MKKTLSTMMILFLAVGFVWASEKSPAEKTDQIEAVVVEDAVLELQEQELDADALALEGAFEDPALVPMGACCAAECMSQRTACVGACNGNIPCINDCMDEFETCWGSC